MKLTIRTKLTLGFLTILVLGSAVSIGILVTLSGSVEKLRGVAERDDMIAQKALELRYDMMTMSDAMRGYLLDPSKVEERQRKLDADDELSRDADEIKRLSDDATIERAVKEVADLDATQLNKLEDDILGRTMAGKVEEARVLYNGDYLKVRRQQEALITAMEEQAQRTKVDALKEAASAYQTARTTTYVLLATLLGLGLGVAFFIARGLAM